MVVGVASLPFRGEMLASLVTWSVLGSPPNTTASPREVAARAKVVDDMTVSCLVKDVSMRPTSPCPAKHAPVAPARKREHPPKTRLTCSHTRRPHRHRTRRRLCDVRHTVNEGVVHDAERRNAAGEGAGTTSQRRFERDSCGQPCVCRVSSLSLSVRARAVLCRRERQKERRMERCKETKKDRRKESVSVRPVCVAIVACCLCVTVCVFLGGKERGGASRALVNTSHAHHEGMTPPTLLPQSISSPRARSREPALSWSAETHCSTVDWCRLFGCGSKSQLDSSARVNTRGK